MLCISTRDNEGSQEHRSSTWEGQSTRYTWVCGLEELLESHVRWKRLTATDETRKSLVIRGMTPLHIHPGAQFSFPSCHDNNTCEKNRKKGAYMYTVVPLPLWRFKHVSFCSLGRKSDNSHRTRHLAVNLRPISCLIPLIGPDCGFGVIWILF